MIIDKNLLFSDAQAETTVAAHDSTNYIDIAVAGDANKELYLVVSVNTTCTSTGSATVQLKMLTDSTTGWSSPVTVFDSGAIAVASLVAGYKICEVRIPKGKLERYTKLTYTIATAALSAGKFDAFLTPVLDDGLV